jgi:predicted NAD/FAD-binding protein
MTGPMAPAAAPPPGQRIAVVGSGVAGLVAAWLLDRVHDVTLFEAEDYPGGHTHTIAIERGPDAGTPVDTGFIVMNLRNYPVLTRVFERLGVGLRDSTMTFGFHDEGTGFQYAGTPRGLFAQPENLLRPSFHRLLADIVRFGRRAKRDLATGALADRTLGDYVAGLGLSVRFRRDYLEPMGAAIWSAPPGAVADFAAEAFLRFFENHGLLTLTDLPQWKTVAGGSHTYVNRMLAGFRGRVRLRAPVRQVRRTGDAVEVSVEGAGAERFDHVVVATHADQALRLLADPSDDERRRLGAWRYSTNRTLLHTDTRVLPPRRAAWAAWNYTREAAAGTDDAVSVTYDMNTLQGLRTRERYLVTLNRRGPVEPARVVAEMTYTHPLYDFASLATQPGLPALNGVRRTWFCGGYFGHGFHEDAARSGLHVARGFGLDL